MTWFQKPPLGTPLDWEKPLNKDLVMHLAMNEGHGDKVQDLSLNGNYGTLNNFAFPPTVASGWNPGHTGIGLNLDGADDFIDCGNNLVLNRTDAITISVIVKMGAATDEGWSSTVKKPGSYILMQEQQTTKLLRTYIWGLTPPNITFVSDADDFIGKWKFVVVTFESGNDRVLYVDGVEEARDTPTGAITSTSSSLYVGGDGGASLEFFNGTIDQTRIQSRAWSAKEVKDYAMNPWQVYLDNND